MVNQESLVELSKIGLDVTPLVDEAKYSIGVINPSGKPIIPRQIRIEAVEDYLKYFKEILETGKRREKRKIEFSRGVLLGKPNLVVKDFVGALYKPARNKILKQFNKAVQSGKTLSKFIKSKSDQKALEIIVLSDMKDLIYSKRQKGQMPDFDKGLTSLELFLEKYDPEVYEKSMGIEFVKGRSRSTNFINHLKNYILKPFFDDISPDASIATKDAHILKMLTSPVLVPLRILKYSINFFPSEPISETNDFSYKDTYELEVTREPKLIKASAKATGSSCLRDYDNYFFEQEFNRRPGVIYMVGRKNGVLNGYARIFVAKDDKDNPVFVLDTIEPPGKNFHENIGFVNALTLGAIQLGFDMGVKYVVSQDSRIKYGPREAFSNKCKRMELRGVGEIARTVYALNPWYRRKINLNVLMENWRI